MGVISENGSFFGPFATRSIYIFRRHAQRGCGVSNQQRVYNSHMCMRVGLYDRA